MYYEAKVLLVLFLWHPRAQGACYLHDAVLAPAMAE